MAPVVLDSSQDDPNSEGRVEAETCAVDRLTLLRSLPEAPQECQVCVVGAGPAGLMTAANLARMGIKVQVVDDRADPTPVGRLGTLELNCLGTHRLTRSTVPMACSPRR